MKPISCNRRKWGTQKGFCALELHRALLGITREEPGDQDRPQVSSEAAARPERLMWKCLSDRTRLLPTPNQLWDLSSRQSSTDVWA